MKNILILVFLIVFSVAAGSTFAVPGAPINKPGIYQSQCKQVNVTKVTDNNLSFNVDLSDCTKNTGSIQNGTANLGCSGEGCAYYFDQNKCALMLVFRGKKILDILDTSSENPNCGFDKSTKIEGIYKKK
jgi:hypothetical protein